MESLIEKEESNWTSKKELAEICKCSTRVLEQIVADLSCEIDFASQIHIKKGRCKINYMYGYNIY